MNKDPRVNIPGFCNNEEVVIVFDAQVVHILYPYAPDTGDANPTVSNFRYFGPYLLILFFGGINWCPRSDFILSPVYIFI
jgi:hypothetical protein